MNQWKGFTTWWRSRSITAKFGLSFGIQLFLLVLIAAVSIGALMLVRHETDHSLFVSAHIQHLVLEMDRHLEKSRRLEGNFFLRYPTIGFSAAYEQYAQPAEEHARRVHALNEEFHAFLESFEIPDVWRQRDKELAFYRATILRYTTVAQEATALVSRLAHETAGLHAQLARHASQLSDLTELEEYPILHQLLHRIHDLEREYFLSGQRPLMQSAFNVIFELKQTVEQVPAIESSHKGQIFMVLEAYQDVAKQILDLNVTLRGLSQEFELQAQALDPVAEEFISLAHQEIEASRVSVKQVSRIVTLLLLLTAFLGFGLTGATAMVFNKSVTRNILKLTRSAGELKAGHLHERARIESADELGQLAENFNTMAARLEELIDSLEEKVVARTISLSTANRHLQEEMSARQQVEEELKRYTGHLERMVDERTQALRQAQNDLVQREKLAILGQLAGGVAHELRHPLGVLSNAAYFLGMTLPDADAKTEEYLTIMTEEIRKAQDIISALLNFARSQERSPESLALPDLVSQVLDEHAPPETILVDTRFDADLPPVYVDPIHIELVLGNIVKNAYQAMPNGGRLSIQAQAGAHNVRLAFSDTGCGLSLEAQKSVFEPLFTTKMRGIGLGMAISKNLIESNGGSIEVEGEEGQGCTFLLTLPCRDLA